MNQSFLSKFYLDYICQCSEDEPQTYEHRKTGQLKDEHCKYFRENLKDEDKRRFEKLDELHNTEIGEYGSHNFVLGFRLATGLLLDALSNGRFD